MYVHPAAFPLYVPGKDRLPPSVPAPIPSVCVQLIESEDLPLFELVQLVVIHHDGDLFPFYAVELCELVEAEAREAELVKAGVAVKVETSDQANDYNRMKMAELRKAAAAAGVDAEKAKAAKSKSSMSASMSPRICPFLSLFSWSLSTTTGIFFDTDTKH